MIPLCIIYKEAHPSIHKRWWYLFFIISPRIQSSHSKKLNWESLDWLFWLSFCLSAFVFAIVVSISFSELKCGAKSRDFSLVMGVTVPSFGCVELAASLFAKSLRPFAHSSISGFLEQTYDYFWKLETFNLTLANIY